MLGLPEVTSKDILDLTAMKAGAPKEIAKEVIENAKTAAATAAGRAEAALEKPGVSFTMKDVDQVRKQIVPLMGDAKRVPGGTLLLPTLSSLPSSPWLTAGRLSPRSSR